MLWNIKDTSGNAHKFNTVNNLLKTNNFQHVALTYDKSSGNAVLYYNGVAVTNANFGSITPQNDLSDEYRQNGRDNPSVMATPMAD